MPETQQASQENVNVTEQPPVTVQEPPQEAAVVQEPEDQQPEDQQPAEEESPRTEFMTIVDALMSGKDMLDRMPQSNPQRLKAFLVNDLYPILIDFANIANWYTGDLHGRVSEVEDEMSGVGGEGIDPEFAAELIQFIGQTLQIFGVIIPALKGQPKLANTVQMLVARAPGLISRIQDLTITEVEEEDDEEEEYEDEGESPDESDVLEPATGEPVSTAEELPDDVAAEEDDSSQNADVQAASEESLGQDQEANSVSIDDVGSLTSGQEADGQQQEQPEQEAGSSEVNNGGNI